MDPTGASLILTPISMGLNAAYQQQMSRDQMRFQSQMAEANRQYESAEWLRRFNAQNDYNNPSAVVPRLIAAGLNPSSIFGSSTTTSATSAPVTSPSGGSLPSPVPNYSGVLAGGFSQSFLDLSNAMRSATEAKKTAAEIPYVSKIMEATIGEMAARMEDEQMKASYTKTLNELEMCFGSALRSKNVQKLEADYAKALADAKLSIAQSGYYDKASYERYTQALKNVADKILTDKQAFRIDYLLSSEKFALERQAQMYGAQANLSNAQALTENELRPYRKAIEIAESEIRGNQSNISASTWRYVIESAREAAEHAHLQNDEKVKDILIKGKNLDYRDAQEVRNWIKTIQGFIPLAPSIPME